MSDKTVHDIADEDLLRRAMMNIRPRRRTVRWVTVMETFGLGSTYAKQLCERFDYDPEEKLKGSR